MLERYDRALTVGAWLFLAAGLAYVAWHVGMAW